MESELKTVSKKLAQDLVKILYDQACIIENQPVSDPASFAKRFNKIIELV